MKVRIKTWEKLVDEFCLDDDGDVVICGDPDTDAVVVCDLIDCELPSDRIIDITFDDDGLFMWNGWLLSKEVIEEYVVDEEPQSTEAVTEERGSNYGHPYDHFQCTQKMFDAWTDRRFDAPTMDEELSCCLKHITYLILDKLARAAHNPLHMDNFVDIQGYASLWEKCVEAHND